MSFSKFKIIIRSLGGVWASSNVYFSQTQCEYSAGYLPAYPDTSKEDSSIYCCWVNGIWSCRGPHGHSY